MSYAEDEADIEGTVNGVTATTTGTQSHSVSTLFFNLLLSSPPLLLFAGPLE